MIFRKGGHVAAREKWYYKGQEIEIVNSYKYLGFTLTTKLSNSSACEGYASKAKGKIMDLMKTMWSLGNLNSTVFFQLFDSEIKPLLLYASEIWGTAKMNVIESAHLFACKRLLGVSDRTPNHLVYGETGRYPLYIESTVSAVRYWLKILKMQQSRFPKQAFEMMFNNLDNVNPNSNRNWALNIKRCLETYGFLDRWENANAITQEHAFLACLKRKMIDSFKQEWHTKINSSDRFATYRIYKMTHAIENYINEVTIKKFRDTLIRFRLGINELGVNQWYKSENEVNKNCPFCPDFLESELHLLFGCPVYGDYRCKYLRCFLQGNSEPTLHMLFENMEVNSLRNLAMFIFYALKLREELIIERNNKQNS
jgi:hypothetical protein